MQEGGHLPMLDQRVTHDSAVITVLVVDGQHLVAELLSAVLQAQDDLSCAGRATSLSSARTHLRTACPDVVVISSVVGGEDGVAFAAELLAAEPCIRVVVTDGAQDFPTVARAAKAGVSVYLPTGAGVVEVLEAVRTCRRGTITAPAHLVAASPPDPVELVDDAALSELTPREREVLVLLAEGLTVDRISRRLQLSLHTTRGYVKRILAKLEAHSQLEAVAVAKRRGLLRSA
jgi:DNA-binding NarL/FixJ family response regulator